MRSALHGEASAVAVFHRWAGVALLGVIALGPAASAAHGCSVGNPGLCDFIVTSPGSALSINGVERPDLTLERGTTYTFLANQSCFFGDFYVTRDSRGAGFGEFNDGTSCPATASGSCCTGFAGNVLTFVVPFDAPHPLYYAGTGGFDLGARINLCSVGSSVVDVLAQVVTGSETFESCDVLNAGTGGFEVASGGTATLHAGSLVRLHNGLSVDTGGALAVFDGPSRYTDCGNGTVRDNRVGLLLLEDASCAELLNTDGEGRGTWSTAKSAAAALANGTCGLTDGSSAGDWRLPTVTAGGSSELPGMVLAGIGLGCTPVLTNDSGTSCWAQGPSSLDDVKSEKYWSGEEVGTG
ncbi:MAG: hypothetical protein IH936_16340, partial [Acidobacteria bacterium]|nr:hypothetical protein [Acidobacteriota bacterium]